MRNFLILLLIIIWTNKINGQSYIKMIDTTNVWDVLCGGITTNGEDFRRTDKLCFIGDTIFGDTIYHKLYSKIYNTTSDSVFQYVCALREDTIQQKIYKKNYYNAPTTEELLYDFSLHSGDSIVLSVDYYNHPNPIKVDSIKTYNICGQNRRVFYITKYLNFVGSWLPIKNRWIEGVGIVDDLGKINGPTNDFDQMIDELLCFWQSNQMLYQNPAYYSCLIIHVGIEEEKSEKNILIYPNPATSYITIDEKYISKENTLILYNIKGQKLLQVNVSDSKSVIDISNLTSGIYFIKFINDKTTELRKIIIE